MGLRQTGPGQMCPRQMGPRTNRSRKNGSWTNRSKTNMGSEQTGPSLRPRFLKSYVHCAAAVAHLGISPCLNLSKLNVHMNNITLI